MVDIVTVAVLTLVLMLMKKIAVVLLNPINPDERHHTRGSGQNLNCDEHICTQWRYGCHCFLFVAVPTITVKVQIS